MARTDSHQNRAPRFVMLAAVCVIVAALYLAREVLIPVALAVLLSFILAPAVSLLERRGLNRGLAVALLAGVVFFLLGILAWVVVHQVDQLAEQIPNYQGNISAKIKMIHGNTSAHFSRMTSAFEHVAEVASSSQPATEPAGATLTNGSPATSQPAPIPVRVVSSATPAQTIRSSLGELFDVLAMALIIVVFVIFMLVKREDLRDRIIRLVGEGQIQLTTRALNDAGDRITHYLVAQCMVNSTYGLAVALGLWLIGFLVNGQFFPSFILWGFLCAVFRFIPYLGPWIGASFPLAVAFAVFPGYHAFIGVAILFVVLEILTSNFMEPWLYGSRTGISAIAILVAAVFWTWLWGIAGLLLSTPMTVCLVVLGKYVPQLAFLDILLGDSPVLDAHQRLYQRLLARDSEEATEVAEAYLAEHSLEDAYDIMLLPALALAEQDRHSGRLDELRGMAIRQNVKELVEELGDTERQRQIRDAAAKTIEFAKEGDNGQTQAVASEKSPPRPSLPKDCTVSVICLPAHDEADEIVGMMLSQLLELRGYRAVNISQNALASEMIDQVQKQDAQIICLSALPPGNISHARYLCKRLYAQVPQPRLVIGLWLLKQDLIKARQRVGCAEETPLAVTLPEALDQIHRLAEPLCVPSQNNPPEQAEQPRTAQSVTN